MIENNTAVYEDNDNVNIDALFENNIADKIKELDTKYKAAVTKIRSVCDVYAVSNNMKLRVGTHELAVSVRRDWKAEAEAFAEGEMNEGVRTLGDVYISRGRGFGDSLFLDSDFEKAYGYLRTVAKQLAGMLKAQHDILHAENDARISNGQMDRWVKGALSSDEGAPLTFKSLI